MKIGDHGFLSECQDAICWNCGASAYDTSEGKEVVYIGHVTHKRASGVYDGFEYLEPVVCSTCGEKKNHHLLICDRDTNITEEIEEIKEKLSVRVSRI